MTSFRMEKYYLNHFNRHMRRLLSGKNIFTLNTVYSLIFLSLEHWFQHIILKIKCVYRKVFRQKIPCKTFQIKYKFILKSYVSITA